MERKITEHFRLIKCICPCCKRVKIVKQFFHHMELLEEMRVILGFPIYITSAYRCKEHNTEVGGSKESQHMIFATDVTAKFGNGFKQRLEAMHKMAVRLKFGSIIYHDSFLHLDTRRRKYHDDKRKTT